MKMIKPVIAISAAALFLAACNDETSESAQKQEQTAKNSGNTATNSNNEAQDRKARLQAMRDRIEIVTAEPAHNDPALRKALQSAKEITGDPLNDDHFLSMTFNVTTKDGEQRLVEALGYCENLVDERDYTEKCSEVFANRLAITNGIFDGPLENYVPTDNSALRENALVSVRWLRNALGNHSATDDYYIVTDIKDAAPAPQ